MPTRANPPNPSTNLIPLRDEISEPFWLFKRDKPEDPEEPQDPEEPRGPVPFCPSSCNRANLARTRGRVPSTTRRGTLLASLLVAACTDSTPAAPTPQTPPPVEPTMLAIELPAGVKVGINGQELFALPIAPREIEPGTYTLKFVTACQELDLIVNVDANETTRVDLDRVSELKTATLEITARDLHGKKLEHSVAIDDVVIGGGKETSHTVLPACTYRVKVASDGLGGFIEDIDLGEEREAKREIVLSPGPDMVRIHGGPFTLGPPPELDAYCSEYPPARYDVVIDDFDIDRTEVTANQWMECRDSGGCKHNGTNEGATKHLSGPNYSLCNVDIMRIRDTPIREGREKYPMNCIAQWQAESYCRWAGKRLLLDTEWEFAARSRKSEYKYSWGSSIDICRNVPFVSYGACKYGNGKYGNDKESTLPCSYPQSHTEQGVCDMMGNLLEITEYKTFSGRNNRERKEDIERLVGSGFQRIQYTMGISWTSSSVCSSYINGRWNRWEQRPRVGFRCARDPDFMPSPETERKPEPVKNPLPSQLPESGIGLL